MSFPILISEETFRFTTADSNSSLVCNKESRRSLKSSPSLNDLFSLNSVANNSLNTDSDSFSFINSIDIIHHAAFRKSNLVVMNTTYLFFTVILGVLD